jgi:hypothetical protein
VLSQIGFAPIYGSPLTNSSLNAQLAIFWLPMGGGAMLPNINVFDAYNLDTKLDDGVADTGRFLTVNQSWGAGNCVTGLCSVNTGGVNYNTGDTVNDCLPIYMLPVGFTARR